MFCPSCRSEFVPRVTRCENCGVALVAELPSATGFGSDEAMAKALEGKSLTQLVVGNHVALREVQRFLGDQRVASIIGSDHDEDEPAVATRFYLLVAEGDLERARTALEARWRDGLAKEGIELAETTAAAGEGVCPACSAGVPEGASECPDCGLFLGDSA
jgi:hypothetical protein